MFKDNRYILAGTNEIYRFGKKAQAKVAEHAAPNRNGFYTIPVDGGKYWTMGTSAGKYGEYMRWEDHYFSVNGYGYAYAKADTEKGIAFVKMLEAMTAEMVRRNKERIDALEEEDDD